MSGKLYSVSISHKTAPLSILEAVAFTKKKQEKILRFIKENIADECVLLSTCNRFELYFAGETKEERVFEYLKESAGGINFAPYAEVYRGIEAVSHLMSTASGLLSMVVGEDQILGQVKEAHAFALDNGAAGIYLNTLFRLAVTGAKRVKTDTLLSKMPVSVATIAIKLCEDTLNGLDGKTALIIGASGKMGSIVYKDLLSLGKVKLLVTTRTHNAVVTEGFEGAEVIDYVRRYDYLDRADIVVSATASPHFTLTADRINAAVSTRKDRIFIDLAVPKDIEAGEGFIYKNISDLSKLSEENNAKKLCEVKKAEEILEKYINEFMVWSIFHKNKPFIDKTNDELRRKIYDAKSTMTYTDFERFLEGIKYD